MPPRAIFALVAALGGVACLDVTPVSERNRLLLFAPSETGARLETLLGRYYAAHGNVVRVVYGRSDEIVPHVAEEPATGLVVVSHPAWAAYIERRRRVLDRAAFAEDRLVVAAAPGRAVDASAAPPDVSVWLERGPPGRVALPSSESDAVGMYAREALLRYGVWVRLQSSLETVQDTPAALARLRAGTVAAAILFASVAEAAGLVTVAYVDPAFHRPIRFEVLLLAEDHANARPLFDFLASAGHSEVVASGQRH